jgi:hypothetical protein
MTKEVNNMEQMHIDNEKLNDGVVGVSAAKWHVQDLTSLDEVGP